ncbi:MAG: hypothetical protein Q4A74_04955 [Cardiobacteriaceae bacterium]|nr:hypothetical protein [Cardiobacteriaceae bacterium]
MAGGVSIGIFLLLYRLFPYDMLKNNGVWTFITLLTSAPVAFMVWHFRDENTRQQIEHQRKDVNLKEFQKIAEWVSGLHFQEGKEITKKIKKFLLKIAKCMVKHQKKYQKSNIYRLNMKHCLHITVMMAWLVYKSPPSIAYCRFITVSMASILKNPR